MSVNSSESATVVFRCNLYGIPRPSITWFHDNQVSFIQRLAYYVWPCPAVDTMYVHVCDISWRIMHPKEQSRVLHAQWWTDILRECLYARSFQLSAPAPSLSSTARSLLVMWSCTKHVVDKMWRLVILKWGRVYYCYKRLLARGSFSGFFSPLH